MGSVGVAIGAAVGSLESLAGDGPSVMVSSGDSLDVRQFTVHERLSSLFAVSLVAHCGNPSIDFEAVIGRPARFTLRSGLHERTWTGICNRLQQIAAEEHGASTYHLDIVPTLWLATQRRNHRMFQQQSELDIALTLLAEWGVAPVKKLGATYKKRKYRVQYAESDFAFLSRMLEDAGITFHFEQQGDESKLVLSDAPQSAEPRPLPLPFRDNPTSADREHVTAVRVSQQVRPGRLTLRDHDYRLPPEYKLLADAAGGLDVEQRLEQFHYTPGAFLFGSDKGEASPVADDRGKTRTDEAEAKLLAKKRLEALRGGALACTFETNALDLAPGVVTSLLDHPHADLGPTKKLLVVESSLSGSPSSTSQHCEARSAAAPYRPEPVTPRPKAQGVESATVVGPKGEEIHTDEFGRVRVHFHWDRESGMDEKSSCWIHVSQSWAGAGFGTTHLPRVGQEVLVDFIGGDPDRPVITGRLYTNVEKTPYKLPENKTQTGWKSNSVGKSGGYNEIMFEDLGGKELLRVQAERDLHKLVKHDEEATIGVNRSHSVGNDESLSVGNNRSETVGSNESVTVGANQSVTVGAKQTITVGAGQMETITGDRTLTLTGNLTETQVGAISVTQKGDRTLTITGRQDLKFKGETTLTQDGDVSVVMKQSEITASTVIVSAEQILLSAPEITIMGPSTVNVGGGTVNVDAGAQVNVRASLIKLN